MSQVDPRVGATTRELALEVLDFLVSVLPQGLELVGDHYQLTVKLPRNVGTSRRAIATVSVASLRGGSYREREREALPKLRRMVRDDLAIRWALATPHAVGAEKAERNAWKLRLEEMMMDAKAAQVDPRPPSADNPTEESKGSSATTGGTVAAADDPGGEDIPDATLSPQ